MAYNETGTITLRMLAQDLASGKVGTFVSHLDAAAKQGGLMGSIFQGVGQSLGQMLNPMALASRGFDLLSESAGKVLTGLQQAAAAWREEEVDLARFHNTLDKSIPDWHEYSGAIDEAIESGMKLAFTDDALRESIGNLATRTRSVSAAIDLTRLAMNVARQKHVGLREASDALVKAYGGQVRALKGLGYDIDSTMW